MPKHTTLRPLLASAFLTLAAALPAQTPAAVCEDSTAAINDRASACAAVASAQPRDSEARHRAAAALRRARRNEEAIEQYRAAIDIDANDAEAHHGLGHALSTLDRDDEALREWRIAQGLTPDDLELWSDILWLLAYLDRMDTVAIEIANLRRATVDSALALKAAGDAVYTAELYADALPFFERALALDSSIFVHHSDVAYTLSRLDRLDDAIAAFQRGIARLPTDTAARLEFADFLYGAGVPLGAVAQFDTIARIAAYDPDPLRMKGDILREIGQHDLAITAYREAVTRDPIRADSHYDLAHGLLSAGRHADAIAEFSIAIRLDSLNAVYHNDLGVAYEQLGRLDTAQVAYGRAAALDEDEMLYHVNYVFATARNGQPDDAKSIVQRWIDRDTTDAKRQLVRAQLFLEFRDADSVLAITSRILAKDSTIADAHLASAVGYMLKADGVSAEASLIRGLAIDPGSARLWATRGLLHTALAQHERAMEYWERARELQPDLLAEENLRRAYDISHAATSGTQPPAPQPEP